MERSSARKRPRPLKPVERPRMPLGLFFRIFVLGAVSIVACVYAIHRHYAFVRPPMLVPAPPVTSGEEPAPDGMLPAPELVPVDAG